jgi:hypothetical protein
VTSTKAATASKPVTASKPATATTSSKSSIVVQSVGALKFRFTPGLAGKKRPAPEDDNDSDQTAALTKRRNPPRKVQKL